MTKAAAETTPPEAPPADNAHVEEGAEQFPEPQPPTADVVPMERGIKSLRDAGSEPLRLWSVKAPKEIGGTLSAVFLQASSEVVILQQLPSGRFVVFGKKSAE